MKQFKHPKLNIYATDRYTNEKGISTYYVKFDGRMGERYEENLLIALGFEEIVPEERHFGNGMIGSGGAVSINTTERLENIMKLLNLILDKIGNK